MHLEVSGGQMVFIDSIGKVTDNNAERPWVKPAGADYTDSELSEADSRADMVYLYIWFSVKLILAVSTISGKNI